MCFYMFLIGELRKAKVRELLNLYEDSMSAKDYDIKFAYISLYVAAKVYDIKNKRNLFI